jgi:hypothetical protein
MAGDNQQITPAADTDLTQPDGDKDINLARADTGDSLQPDNAELMQACSAPQEPEPVYPEDRLTPETELARYKKRSNAKEKTCHNQIYTDDMVKELLARVAENGSNLKEECEKAGLKYNTIFKRMSRSEELRQLDTRARLASLDLRVRSMNELVDSEPDTHKARLKCDNIKWEAARVYRKVYGDQITVEHTQTPLAELSDDELLQRAASLAARMKTVSEQ